jgi:hypothetical protein
VAGRWRTGGCTRRDNRRRGRILLVPEVEPESGTHEVHVRRERWEGEKGEREGKVRLRIRGGEIQREMKEREV